MGAQFCANSGCQSEIARIAGHIFAYRRDGKCRDSISGANIHHLCHVDNRLPFEFTADENLDGHGTDIQTDRFFDIHGNLLVGKLLEDAGAARYAQNNGLLGGRWDNASEDAPGEHQCVCVRNDGKNIDVYPFESCCGSLKITVIDGQHHRAAGLRVEDSGQSVFHPPVQSIGAFQEKTICFLGYVGMKLLCIFQVVHVGHNFFSFPNGF